MKDEDVSLVICAIDECEKYKEECKDLTIRLRAWEQVHDEVFFDSSGIRQKVEDRIKFLKRTDAHHN